METAPRWSVYTNANHITGVAIDDATGEVWTSSLGGVVRWNPTTGASSKMTALDGLSDSNVNNVAIDPRTGSKWFGTPVGVSHLDATGAWSKYWLEEELVYRDVHPIAIDTDTGDVWFGTVLGASRRSASGEWTTFTSANGLAHDIVRAIVIDPESGDRWFGTHGGVSRWTRDGVWTSFTTEDGLSHDLVRAIAIDRDTGDVWFGTEGGGVSRRAADGSWSKFSKASIEGLASDTVFSIAIDPTNGDLWFATDLGVSRRTRSGVWSAFSESDGLIDARTTSVAFDDATGAVWLGTVGGLSRRARSGAWTTFRTDVSLADNGVNDIGIDLVREDTWFATNLGASLLSAAGEWRTLTREDGLASNVVSVVAIDADTNTTWFGTGGAGISLLDTTGEWTHVTTDEGLGSNFVWQIEFDHANGRVWVGHGCGGASLYAEEEGWTSISREAGLASDCVRDIAIDPSTGAAWFATDNGASRRSEDGTWTRYDTESGLRNSNVQAVEVEPTNGAVWFGTWGGGVSRISRTGEWTTYTEDTGLVFDFVSTLAADRHTGGMWIGTGLGLNYRSSDGEWSTFTTANGLPGNLIRTIGVDPLRDDIWVGTISGASVLHRADRGRDSECATATAIAAPEGVVASLSGPTDVHYYSFEVDRPFTHVQASIPDPDGLIGLEVFRACGTTAGTGSGRHIGTGTGRHIGGLRQAELNVTFNTGTYYVAVYPQPGAEDFPLRYHLQLSLGAADPDYTHTLILADLERLAEVASLETDSDEISQLRRRLSEYAGRREVGGLLVPNVRMDTDAAVDHAYKRWIEDPSDVGRANAVARALRDWIARVRVVLPGIRNVVLVGDDRILPHLRLSITSDPERETGWVRESEYLPDSGIDPESPIGVALRHDFTLTDDVYAAPAPATWGALEQEMYVPEIAVARLVEHPDDISAVLQAYLDADGLLILDTALTAGYDFMQDAVELADGTLADAGLDAAPRARLWDRAFTVPALRRELLDERRDLAFLGAHADHGSLRLADGLSLPAAGIRTATADLAGTLIYGMACHAGLNAPGLHPRPLDFPEAWSARGATWIGSTGWAYGLPRFLGYQEDLLTGFTHQLFAEDGGRVGEALADAKRAYVREHALNALHAKTLAGTVLYGLPTWRVQVPRVGGMLEDETEMADDAWRSPSGAREPASDDARRLDTDGAATRLADDLWILDDRAYPFRPDELQRHDQPAGSYFAYGEHRPRAEAGEPVQPRWTYELGRATDGARVFEPRGIVFTSARYVDVPDFDPLVSSAGVMSRPSRAVARAAFDAEGWTPALPVNLRVVDRSVIDDRPVPANLVFHVGQFHAPSRIQRLYEEIVLDEYYSTSADRAGPSAPDVAASAHGDEIALSVSAADPSGIERVVVAYTSGEGAWLSRELVLAGAGDVWMGVLPAAQTYLVQIVDGAGNVTTVDDRDGIHRTCVGPCESGVRGGSLYLPALESGAMP